MRRSLLRCTPARRTCAVAASLALLTGLRGASTAIRAGTLTKRTTVSTSSLSSSSPSASFPRSALTHTSALYATKSGEDAGDEHSQQREDPSSPDGNAVEYSSHTASLRDALPPSAVELPETSFLKCIDKEIMDEKYRLDKEEGAPPVPVGWTMHHTEGTSFIYGRRVWVPPPPASATSGSEGEKSSRRDSQKNTAANSEGEAEAAQESAASAAAVPRAVEKHFLRLQLTTRDASLDPECDVRGEHFPFSFFVQRVRPEDATSPAAPAAAAATNAGMDVEGDAFDEHTFYHDSIEVRCDVVDGELLVDNVVYHGPPGSDSAAGSTAGATRPHYANPFGGYPGPSLDESEEEVLDGIQSWLAERGVDDQLGEFVGQYAIWIEQAEYEMWLQQLRDYVAA